MAAAPAQSASFMDRPPVSFASLDQSSPQSSMMMNGQPVMMGQPMMGGQQMMGGQHMMGGQPAMMGGQHQMQPQGGGMSFQNSGMAAQLSTNTSIWIIIGLVVLAAFALIGLLVWKSFKKADDRPKDNYFSPQHGGPPGGLEGGYYPPGYMPPQGYTNNPARYGGEYPQQPVQVDRQRQIMAPNATYSPPESPGVAMEAPQEAKKGLGAPRTITAPAQPAVGYVGQQPQQAQLQPQQSIRMAVSSAPPEAGDMLMHQRSTQGTTKRGDFETPTGSQSYSQPQGYAPSFAPPQQQYQQPQQHAYAQSSSRTSSAGSQLLSDMN